jgi:hypothetical protein
VKVIAKAAFKHDGKDVKAGQTVDVTDSQAKRLISLGFGFAAPQSEQPNVDKQVLSELSSGDGESEDADSATEDQSEGDEDPFGGGGDVLSADASKRQPVESMTREELKADLAAAGVPFHANETKASLQDKLKAVREETP